MSTVPEVMYMGRWPWSLDRTALLAGLSLVLAAVGPPVSHERAAATDHGEPTANWPCAGASTGQAPRAGAALYVLRSIGPQSGTDQQPIWGNDPAGRGPTRVSRLDPRTGAIEATDGDPGVGLSARAGSDRLARLDYTEVGAGYPPAVTGVELLDATTLRRVDFLSVGGSWSGAAIASAGGGRVVAVEAAGVSLAIDAVCHDPTQITPVARLRLLDPAEGFFGCGVVPLVRFVGDGSAFVVAPLCRSHPESGALRLYRINVQGGVTHVDLPFFPYAPPVGFSADGSRLFIADHQRQELFSVATESGAILWRSRYGAVPPEAGKLKIVGAPNHVALSPDGKRLYLTSNWEPQPSPGVWVFDAATGAVQGRILPEVGATGIAVDADGNLFVASPTAGGQLWVLPGGDPQRGRLVRKDLGDRLSGVVVVN